MLQAKHQTSSSNPIARHLKFAASAVFVCASIQKTPHFLELANFMPEEKHNDRLNMPDKSAKP
jgi:hypothetical protein